jgi:hypothetical protein
MSKSQNPTKEVIPIMKKRIYRRMPVNDFQPQSISPVDLGGKLIFAIDIAKVDMVAALAAADGRVLQTICWKAPEENLTVLSILRSFRAAGVTVEAVMEPSGTYGDALRHPRLPPRASGCQRTQANVSQPNVDGVNTALRC